MSYEEYKLRQERQIGHIDALDIAQNGIPESILPSTFPENIYITFDVDVFDPALVPATGTPEPGGLSWHEVTDILGAILSERNIIGMDLVELAPIPGMHAPDFAIARLIYNVFGMITKK